MQFRNLLKPTSVEEACRCAALPDTVVLGGGMWVRMQKRTFENAVDLSALGLNQIEETEEGIRIGAYVTLHALETSPLMLAYTKGAVKTAFAPIVGVQFRNSATVGGSVFGRFGFSDVTTLLSALGATVVFGGKGKMPLTDFVKSGVQHDILTHILLPNTVPDACVSVAHRESATDFPLVTAAAVKHGETVTLTASPAPVRALTQAFSVTDADIPARFMASLPVKENSSDAVKYRERITHVLLNRAVGGLR